MWGSAKAAPALCLPREWGCRDPVCPPALQDVPPPEHPAAGQRPTAWGRAAGAKEGRENCFSKLVFNCEGEGGCSKPSFSLNVK